MPQMMFPGIVYGFFQDFSHVAFAENASFKGYGVIFLLPQLVDELSMGSDGFFLTRLLLVDSYSSYNTTDLSLILILISPLSSKESLIR